ncbi:MAG: PaaI family thioesterase [Chitinophagales bacterium]|nr:PaaI family thioesterase [Chitinophagales bacterium]
MRQVIFEKAKFLQHIQAKLGEIKDGYCSIELPIQDFHLQQDGFVHAGVQATIADHACGIAASTVMPEGKIPLSIEFKVNMLRPAVGERLVAIGTVLKAGKTIVVTEGEVWAYQGEQKKLTAKMQATMAVVEL